MDAHESADLPSLSTAAFKMKQRPKPKWTLHSHLSNELPSIKVNQN